MHTVSAQGALIPALGFGTYELTGELCCQMVEIALGLGYRHLDTATIYKNEQEVGAGIAAAGIPRDQIFLTTKVWTDCFSPAALAESVRNSLRRLQTEYVDLLLLHWPVTEVSLAETIPALNQACREGHTRFIGVSNFTAMQVAEAVAISELPLVTNQVEYHPFLDQTPIFGALKPHGMSLTAYSPLAHGDVAKDPTLQEIGAAHGKSAIQTGLRWLVQQDGVITIPRSSNAKHAAANLDIFDFELAPDEMDRITAMTRRNQRHCSPPELAPAWDPPGV